MEKEEEEQDEEMMQQQQDLDGVEDDAVVGADDVMGGVD